MVAVVDPISESPITAGETRPGAEKKNYNLCIIIITSCKIKK